MRRYRTHLARRPHPRVVLPAKVPPPKKPPNRLVLASAWLSLAVTLLFAGVVVANELKKDEKVSSAEAPSVVLEPVWVSDENFRWNDIEWTPAYGGCAAGCKSIHAVVAKTESCWRMATEDGSLYVGQRLFNGVAPPKPPGVRWKLLPGTWITATTFTDEGGRRWRLHHLGIVEAFATQPRLLQVVEVETGAGPRLITRGGSMLVGTRPEKFAPPKVPKVGPVPVPDGEPVH